MSSCDGSKPAPPDDQKPVDCTTNPCPRTLRIRPKKVEYVVVLDKNGAVPSAYPILEFDITDGPPGHAIDVQVSRDDASLLRGGPGLKDSWDKRREPAGRIQQPAFSSHTNGDTGIVLDGSGKATYKMPLEWWRDQARRPRKEFSTATMYYRAVASASAGSAPAVWSTKDGDGMPSVRVHANLVSSEVIDRGQGHDGGSQLVVMQFTVREPGTTEMYTIVQWKTGRSELWPQTPPGSRRYAEITDYKLQHRNNNPDSTVDRTGTDPRYRDGAFTISADKRTASTDDEPGGGAPMAATDTHKFFALDFETRIHLNFDVPAAVTIIKQEGSPPVYDMLQAMVGPPAPLTVDKNTWKVRILWTRTGTTVTVTHPPAFTGP